MAYRRQTPTPEVQHHQVSLCSTRGESCDGHSAGESEFLPQRSNGSVLNAVAVPEPVRGTPTALPEEGRLSLRAVTDRVA